MDFVTVLSDVQIEILSIWSTGLEFRVSMSFTLATSA